MDCLKQRKKFKNKHPAWEDPGDAQGTHSDGPAHKFVDINPEKPNRGQGDGGDELALSSSDDDDDYELVAGEIRSKKIRLESKTLRFKHLTNINNDRSFNGSVQQVQFHPMARMALVTLSKGQVDLYEVDGERNRYIQNIKLPYCKQPYCSFKPDGHSIVISAINYKGKFVTYDMMSGSIKQYGLKVGKDLKDMTDFTMHNNYMACRLEGNPDVLVLSSKTYENAFSLKLNEPVKAIRFSKDYDIFIAGENAHVYVWDVRKTSLCKQRFQDEGAVQTSAFDLSDTAGSLTLGSNCGIVNSYNISDCMASKFPKPTKTYTNLQTDVNLVRYNHSGELLLFGSSQQASTIRLVHSLSGSVYRNFPILQKDYGRLASACFSPLSGYLALGSHNGRAYLCRIPYYKSY